MQKSLKSCLIYKEIFLNSPNPKVLKRTKKVGLRIRWGKMKIKRSLNLNVPEFNLDTPGRTLRTCEELFYWQGLELAVPRRLNYLVGGLCSLGGLASGLDPSGSLYGPVGGIIGASLGFVLGWLSVEALLRLGLGRLSFSYSLRNLIRSGRYSQAGDLCARFRRKRERLFNQKERFWGRLFYWLTLVFDWIMGQYYPLEERFLISILYALEGILREAGGELEPAVELYQESLRLYPANAYCFYALVSLWEIRRDLKVERGLISECITALEKSRSALARVVLSLYQPWLEEELKSLPAEPELDREEVKIKPVAKEEKKEPGLEFYQTSYYLRLIENPGGPVPGGLLEVENDELTVVRLAPMPFQLAQYLAQAMKEEQEKKRHPDQQGWVPVQELVEKLPWTVGGVDASNVHKLVYKLRRAFRQAGVDENLIEYNNGCYRLSTSPARIQIERFQP